jgi:ketosteroid isomerase-like protein
MRTLRQRYEEGFAQAPLELLDAGPDVIVAVVRPRDAAGQGWPAEAATVIMFRHGKVVSMQDYLSKDEALASVG